MPYFPAVGDAARDTGNGISMAFLDFAGRQRSSRIEVAPTAVGADMTALVTAVANASNAALISDTRDQYTRLANVGDADVIAYDESYGSVGDVAVMIFTDALGNERALEIPAPDLPLFNSTDYETVDPASPLGAAIVTAALAVLNAGGAAYTYSRGFYSKRKTKRVAPRNKPGTIGEPGAGDLPPP